MFKNNKEKEINYMSTEEVEKMYEFQKKTFNSKIAEQEKKIEELTNYVSARFGEDVANSNVASTLEAIEKNLQDMETKHKTSLEKNTKSLKKEIEKESQKIAAELNDAQTEAYFKMMQKNESDLEKIKNYFEEQKEKNEDKEANKKIGKMNYLGLSSKIDKKIKEECVKLDDQIEEVKKQTREDINRLDGQFFDKLEQVQANLQLNGEEIIKLQKMIINDNEKLLSNVENNENRVVVLDERLTEEIESVDEDLQKIEKSINKLDNKLIKEIETVNSNLQNTKKQLDAKYSKEIGNVQNIKNIANDLEEKFLSEIQGINEKIKNNDKISNELDKICLEVKENAAVTNKLDKKLAKEVEKINISLKNNDTLVNNLDKRVTDEIEKVNANMLSDQKNVNDLGQQIKDEIGQLKIKIEQNEAILKKQENKLKEVKDCERQTNEDVIKQLEEKLSKEILTISNDVQSNEMAIVGLEGNWTKKIEQTKEAINKLKDIAKNKNIKLEEKIKVTGEKITATQEELKTIEANLETQLESIKQQNNDKYVQLEEKTSKEIETKIQEAVENIGNSQDQMSKINTYLKQIKKETLIGTEKIKSELNEQITNNYNENKTELENISESVEDIKTEMENSITTIGKEILKIKKEVKASLENQGNEDIELLKKDYNKYVTKINNELAKISKDLLNAQKKNSEQNRNLQVKIKSYIDAKVDQINNVGNIEDLINDLTFSILEREKKQKLELEEWLDKKLKAIQKENERLLNKKIEEISSKLIRDNITNTRTKPNNVTFYEEMPVKKKKSMYDIIDEDQILKRSASSKRQSLPTKEERSQILKFFYDEEDEF